ncbi:MAG: hypothetical protein WBV94_00510 [Blastocatellia bacterium]
MKDSSLKPKIGVMGSAGDVLTESDRLRLLEIAKLLGEIIADRGCVLVTGATTGLPDLVSRAARSRGGLTIGISPAFSKQEHVDCYNLPTDGADVIIYTGFGLKGRNVINIRSSDIVIIFGGGMGALNEFTIAYDEGKVIGVLDGSGGIADHLREIVDFAKKQTHSQLIYNSNPETLIDLCLQALSTRMSET